MSERTDVLAAKIVLALSQDLQNEVEWPQKFNVVELRRPPIVTPEMCPLLCVWLMQKAFAPRTTNSFQSVIAVGVTWQTASPDIDDLLAHPEDSLTLLGTMDGIEQRIRALSLASISTGIGLKLDDEFLPPVTDLIPSSIDYMPPTSLDTGLVEGYAMTVHALVTEKG